MKIPAENIKILSIIFFLIVVFQFIKELYIRLNITNPQSEKEEVSISKEILTNIISMTLFSRVAIFLLGYITIMLSKNSFPNVVNSMKTNWIRWDATHYLNIAQHWYQTTGDNKYLIVFYPLYPMVVKGISFIINDYFTSGLIVSNVCLIIASIYLYKISRLDFDHAVSIKAVKYLLICPFSFFLGITYGDSLFLCLSLISFYLMRQKKWFYAGAIGGITSASRAFGVVLIIPVLIEYLLDSRLVEHIKNRNFKIVFNISKQAWFVFLFPLGLAFYFCINKIVTGSWSTGIKYEYEHWNLKLGFFPDTIKMLYMNAHSWEPSGKICLWVPQLLLSFLVLMLIYFSIKKLRISYSGYMLAYWIMIFSLTWLLSAGRYIVPMFPVYIVLGILSKNEITDFVLTMTFTLLLCFYSMAFIQGHPIL